VSYDGDGHCKLGLPCYKKRMRSDDYNEWAQAHVPLQFRRKIEDEWTNCPCALVMENPRWICMLGLGCKFGFYYDTEKHQCECQTICVRCYKWDRMSGGHLICAKCCHDLHHGTVRKVANKFYKMYRKGTTVDTNFKEVPLYEEIKTASKCGECLQEIHNAAKANRYEL
jgi:hypothetical protein